MERISISRRKLLAATGATAANLGTAGTVIARKHEDPSEVFTRQMVRAHQIAKEEGIDERQKYLDRIDVNHVEKDLRFSVQKDESDGDRIQTASETPICVDPLECDADIDVQFSLSYNPLGEEFHYSYYIQFRYGFGYDPSYPWRTIYAGPEDPSDTLDSRGKRID